MPTIAESLQYAANRLDAAVTSVLGLLSQMQQLKDDAVAATTTIINNFNARPLYVATYVDPANGNDANDGKTIATAKRKLDTVLGDVGSQGLLIYLLGNDTIAKRYFINTNLQFVGIQPANNANGFILFNRTISFLGTATNSPSASGDTYTAGLFFAAGSLFTSNINMNMPDVPAGLQTRSHFSVSAFCSMQLIAPTITVGSANAGYLIGSFNSGRLTATIANAVLGSGVTGHLFDGIAAGANPNANWSYATNLTAA